MCVEISFDCSFPSLISLWIDGVHVMDLPVEYQWKPPKCIKCCCFGHKASSCSVKGVKKKDHWTHKKNQQLSKSVEVGNGNILNIVNPINKINTSVEENFSAENGARDCDEVLEATILSKNDQSNLSNGQQDVEVACKQPLQVSVEGCVSGSGGGALELLATPPEWTYVRRNKKNTGKKDDKLKPKQDAICDLNPYDLLGTDLGMSNSSDARVEEARIEEDHDPKGTQSSLVANDFSTPISSTDLI